MKDHHVTVKAKPKHVDRNNKKTADHRHTRAHAYTDRQTWQGARERERDG